MFSYGTGGLHTLPLHLVRFLWLPALNVCSRIGDRFLLLAPIQSSPSDYHYRFYVVQLCFTTSNPVFAGEVWIQRSYILNIWLVKMKINWPLPSCVDGPFSMHVSVTSHPSVIMLWPSLTILDVHVYLCCVVNVCVCACVCCLDRDDCESMTLLRIIQ